MMNRHKEFVVYNLKNYPNLSTSDQEKIQTALDIAMIEFELRTKQKIGGSCDLIHLTEKSQVKLLGEYLKNVLAQFGFTKVTQIDLFNIIYSRVIPNSEFKILEV